MSAPKLVSERDAVLRERAAFSAGFRHHSDWLRGLRETSPALSNAWSEPVGVIRERYPLPPITRPRVVRDVDLLEYRVRDDRVVWRRKEDAAWGDDTYTRCTSASADIVARRFALWADLLASPTEEVEDDGAAVAPSSGAET